MNCEEYWNEAAGPEPAVDFDAHLAACPSCAARYAAGRPVVECLRLLAADGKRVSAPPRVEAHLLRAYRARYGQQEAPARESRYWWAAAAAVLLAAAGLWTSGRAPKPALVAVSAPAAVAVVNEDDAGFIPLPGAAVSSQDDDVDLVRVELPRSAVTALGIPANDFGDASSVEAEVLVGPDGMARAVRFLN